MTRGGELTSSPPLLLKSSLPISGVGGAPTPYRPEYVRGISFELRRERRGGDVEEEFRTPIVSSSLMSIYSREENRLLGVDGAEDAIVVASVKVASSS